MKKILIVDDSALMRRVLCDIINSDERFEVADTAENGREALELLRRKKYDAVVLDVNMPVMTGLELLEELRRSKISARVMMASTLTKDGAKTTIRALELGALDFIHKPSAVGLRLDLFKRELLTTLEAVASAKKRVPKTPAPPDVPWRAKPTETRRIEAPRVEIPRVELPDVKRVPVSSGKKIVAIASSTGGPKALQSVIPYLPGNLDAPVLLVQHMPVGFTESLAVRLDGLSDISVKEAVEGEELKKGVVYIARGGLHMNVRTFPGGRDVIRYSDEPMREGVKPCANYMYESLAASGYDEVVCVVMTGMGADGTAGIQTLKRSKPVYVVAQNEKSCVVYGMPKSVAQAGLADREIALEQIAKEIVSRVGVR